MEKGGKFDKWVIRLLGGDNTNDGNPQKSENSSYEELLLQEEAHRQALEQQLLDAKSEREFLAAEARAEAQHQREMLRIKNDAIALDQQRQKNMEFMADFRRENPTVTSIINNGDSFEVTWDPSLNINSKKSNKEVECENCSETTPAAAFCSHCGHKL
jgi:hypothetical protein